MSKRSVPRGPSTDTLFGARSHASKVSGARLAAYLRTRAQVRAWVEVVLELDAGDLEADTLGALQSGVVLAYLMNTLEPRSIPRIAEATRDQKDFRLKENVIFFLEAAAEYGVPRHRIFTLPDLLERRSEVNVVECVAALADAAVAKGVAVPGMPMGGSGGGGGGSDGGGGGAASSSAVAASSSSSAGSAGSTPASPQAKSSSSSSSPSAKKAATPSSPAAPAEAALSDADKALVEALPKAEAKALTEQLGRLREARGGGHVVRIAPAIMRRKLRLLTGGDSKKAQAVERGVARMQALFRGWKQRTAYHRMRRHIAYRDSVSKEILSTEESYRADLDSCVAVFLQPVQAARKKLGIAPADIAAIFGDLSAIADFAGTMEDSLRPIVAEWQTNSRIGEVFLRLLPFLKIYTTYVKNFDTAVDTLLRVRKKSKKFDQFINTVKVEHAERLRNRDLTDFLIMPVQRIPRYAMLLQDLAKHTWEDHPDYEDLHAAVKGMEGVAQFLNERKRDAENRSGLVHVQAALGGPAKSAKVLDGIQVVQAGRELVYHSAAMVVPGSAKMMPAKSGKSYPKLKPEYLHLYLFNDFVLLAKGDAMHAPKIEYRDHWSIDQLTATGPHLTPEGAKAPWRAPHDWVDVLLADPRAARDAAAASASAAAAAAAGNGKAEVADGPPGLTVTGPSSEDGPESAFRILAQAFGESRAWMKAFERALEAADAQRRAGEARAAKAAAAAAGEDGDAASAAGSEDGEGAPRESVESKLRRRRLATISNGGAASPTDGSDSPATTPNDSPSAERAGTAGERGRAASVDLAAAGLDSRDDEDVDDDDLASSGGGASASGTPPATPSADLPPKGGGLKVKGGSSGGSSAGRPAGRSRKGSRVSRLLTLRGGRRDKHTSLNEQDMRKLGLAQENGEGDAASASPPSAAGEGDADADDNGDAASPDADAAAAGAGAADGAAARPGKKKAGGKEADVRRARRRSLFASLRPRGDGEGGGDSFVIGEPEWTDKKADGAEELAGQLGE